MTTGTAPIRALVVQEASAQSAALIDVLAGAVDIRITGESATAADAIDQVASSHPDVVILDLHLRGGQSQRAVEQIMAYHPTPILILSAGTDGRDSPSAVEALVAGAVDALPRPARWTAGPRAELLHAVRQISKVHVIRHPRGLSRTTPRKASGPATQQAVVAIAASTGGPSAMAILLAGLAGLDAPVLAVQHVHPNFIAGLIDWMSRVSALPVETAADRQVARAGRVYIAPGGQHLRYCANGRLELDEQPATTHRPSADELFRSVAEHAGQAAVGVLLTGMGDDGASGLLAIRREGGTTLAQDEASSAVFGMPKAAQRLGAVGAMLPIDQLAAGIRRAVDGMRDR